MIAEDVSAAATVLVLAPWGRRRGTGGGGSINLISMVLISKHCFSARVEETNKQAKQAKRKRLLLCS